MEEFEQLHKANKESRKFDMREKYITECYHKLYDIIDEMIKKAPDAITATYMTEVKNIVDKAMLP